MKKKFLFLILALLLALAGCASNPSAAQTEAPVNAPPAQGKDSPVETPSSEDAAAPSENAAAEPGQTADIPEENASAPDGTLVVYFSCTGTTKGVAETISEVTGGDLFEIVPVQSYTADDLNWHDDSSRTTLEQNDPSVRPEIAEAEENWASYSTVYIGYPIWWGEEPRIMDTFTESYDFTGKTVVPFCTSGGSGVGRSDDNLIANAKGDGNWLEGTRLKSGASANDISDWISGLNID